MTSWSVYKHISPSGKVYIGISSNVKRRWSANGYYYHLSDTIFSRALRKYGWDSFEHVILQENLTKEEACNMEKELIAYYKARGISYNITDGGEGFSGKHSDEHKRHRLESRIANSNVDYLVIDKDFNYAICQTEREAAEYLGGKQNNISHVLRQPIGYTFKKHYLWKHKKGTSVDIEDIKSKILEALAIRKQRMSEHTKAISAKMVEGSRKERASLTEEEIRQRYSREHAKGWHHSEEAKRKMSQKAKGRDMSKAIEVSSKMQSKAVIQMLNGLEINTFNSVKEAAMVLNINPSNISNCACGRRKTAGGFNWKYKKEKEVQYVCG